MALLLIEDDTDLRQILGYALQRQGFSVTTNLNECQQVEIEAVLLDVDGADPAKMDTLYHLHLYQMAPIFALTTRDDVNHIAECLRLGAEEVFVKPFSVPHLAHRLRVHAGLPQAKTTRSASIH